MGKWDYAAWSLRAEPDEDADTDRPMVKPSVSVLPEFWDDTVEVVSGEPAQVDAPETVRDDPAPEPLSPVPQQRQESVHEGPLVSPQVADDSGQGEGRTWEIIGQSAALHDALNLAQRVAATRTTVLLEGESGTGKGLMAREIHERSNRSARSYVVANCAGESQLESRLFGHVRGAFTGAAKSVGLFERAEGGTLVLKEVADTTPRVQAKLLRAIQDKAVEPLGGDRAVEVDVRLVATTSRVLADEVRAGRFREDLFYRLHAVKITLPPLGDRKEDIKALANHFVGKYSKEHQRLAPKISSEAMAALKRHSWPGNVRELESAMDHAVVMCAGDAIQVDHLPQDLEAGGPSAPICEGQPTQIRASRRRLNEMVNGPSLPDADDLLGELLRVAHLETSTVTGAARSVGYSYPRFRDRLVSLVILPALESAGADVRDEKTVREVALGLGIHPKVLVDWVNAEDRQKKKRTVHRNRPNDKTRAKKL